MSMRTVWVWFSFSDFEMSKVCLWFIGFDYNRLVFEVLKRSKNRKPFATATTADLFMGQLKLTHIWSELQNPIWTRLLARNMIVWNTLRTHGKLIGWDVSMHAKQYVKCELLRKHISVIAFSSWILRTYQRWQSLNVHSLIKLAPRNRLPIKQIEAKKSIFKLECLSKMK